jgi:hypothetical protein
MIGSENFSTNNPIKSKRTDSFALTVVDSVVWQKRQWCLWVHKKWIDASDRWPEISR